MPNPRQSSIVLADPEYRETRQLALTGICYGGLMLVVSGAALAGMRGPRDRDVPDIFFMCLAVSNACGILGSIGILCRSHIATKAAYIWLVSYVWQFPIGMAVAVLLWQKLGRYLEILR